MNNGRPTEERGRTLPREHCNAQMVVCAICFKKPSNDLRRINPTQERDIVNCVFRDFSEDEWSWLPKIICGSTCRKNLPHWSKERASAGGDLRYDINVIPIPQLLKSNILMVARRLLDVKSVDYKSLGPPSHRPRARACDGQPEICNCSVCEVAHLSGVAHYAHNNHMCEPPVRPRQEAAPDDPEPLTVCDPC